MMLLLLLRVASRFSTVRRNSAPSFRLELDESSGVRTAIAPDALCWLSAGVIIHTGSSAEKITIRR